MMVGVVRIAGSSDAVTVGRVFAAGFGDDPVMGWVFAEPGRAAKLSAFFGFVAPEAFIPMGATYLLPGSVATWTPPGTPEWPEERGRRFDEMFSTVATDDDRERLGILGALVEEHHPRDELWYLSAIATVPESRGKGLASQLLAESLRRVDLAGLPAYLESTNPRNVPLYERHGFRVRELIELPAGPTLTTMWRDPASS